jgi:PAS domain S-box-containing protein
MDPRDMTKEQLVAELAQARRTIEGLESAQAALRAALERAEAGKELLWGVLDNSPDVIARFDKDARHLYMNATGAAICGFSPEAVVGKSTQELGFPPEACGPIEAANARAFATGEPQSAYFAFEFPGGVSHMEVRWSPEIVDGQVVSAIIVARDVSAQKGLEGELARQQRLMRRIIDFAPAGIGYLNRDLIFEWVNPALGRFVSDAEQAIGRSVYEVFGPETEAQLGAIFQSVLEGEPYYGLAFPFKLSVEGQEQLTHWDFTFQPIREDGEVVGILALSQEVSARVEKEHLQLERISALEKADALKDEFLSVVSHELRTPVHIVMGLLRLLLKDGAEPLNTRQRSLVGKAERKTADLAGIVNAVLDFSQLSSGALKLVPEQVEVGAYLRELASSLADLASAKGQTFTAAIPDGLPAAWFDPLRIGQVVTNLVGNAVKFTPEGGTIRLTAQAQGARLRVEVRDSGIGIEAAQHERVFQRFVQVDMGLTRGADGVGLGLAIAKQLIEVHGGTIGLESAPGEGSTFWFEVPLGGP